MECWKGRFIMKFIFKVWCLEFFLGLIYIFYFRTTLYQLLATSLNSGRCGLFLNGRTRWLLIPLWQIYMIIWNICLRWEFYTGSPPLTRFFGPEKNRVKGKPCYRRSIFVLKQGNGTFLFPKSTFWAISC